MEASLFVERSGRRHVENLDEKPPEVSRLETTASECFVEVAGNSNRGVPIRKAVALAGTRSTRIDVLVVGFAQSGRADDFERENAIHLRLEIFRGLNLL